MKNVDESAQKKNDAYDQELAKVFFARYDDACKNRSISVSAAAKAIDEPSNAATRWKTATKPPHGGILQRLSKYLNVSVDYLLGNNLYDYSPQDKELLEIFRELPDSQKHALLSVAYKLKEDDTCLDVSVKKKQTTVTEVAP